METTTANNPCMQFPKTESKAPFAPYKTFSKIKYPRTIIISPIIEEITLETIEIFPLNNFLKSKKEKYATNTTKILTKKVTGAYIGKPKIISARQVPTPAEIAPKSGPKIKQEHKTKTSPALTKPYGNGIDINVATQHKEANIAVYTIFFVDIFL